MKEFIRNIFHFLRIIIIPILILFGLYLYLDPFKVIYDYDTFYDINKNGWVGLNRDYTSTTSFVNNHKKLKINYNSFIFGNSRSMFYQVSDWSKHLPKNSNCYHFDASGESLWALNKKIEFINNQGFDINSVLLILDYETLIQVKPKSGHIGTISPILINNSNLLDFHLTSFEAFISPIFLYTYLDFKISGKIKPYMKENHLLSDTPLNYDIKTNEIKFDLFEELINKNEYYTKDRLSVFRQRDTLLNYSPVSIYDTQKVILKNIQNIFKQHNTNFKIIINPLYDQVRLNNGDVNYLKNLFGANNVFNFSGINKFTNNYTNYYEDSHYRPHVARMIIEEIYRDE